MPSTGENGTPGSSCSAPPPLQSTRGSPRVLTNHRGRVILRSQEAASRRADAGLAQRGEKRFQTPGDHAAQAEFVNRPTADGEESADVADGTDPGMPASPRV